MEVVSSNPSQATSFLFFSTTMITFVLCNIFELIWYSEFILEDFFQPTKLMNVHLETDSTPCILPSGYYLFHWIGNVICIVGKIQTKPLTRHLFFNKKKPSDARRVLTLQCNGLKYFMRRLL